MGRVKWIWYLSPMRAAKVQASLRIRAVTPEPPLHAHTSSESRGTFWQKARYLASLNGWACAVKICHAQMSFRRLCKHASFHKLGGIYNYTEYVNIWAPSSEFVSSSIPSWQILTAHAQPFSGARDLAFCLTVPHDSLAWTFAARIGDKYQIRLTRYIL